MKTWMALVLALVVLSPAVAFAGSATDAALGLGAFAVFNQILGGVGVFGGVPRPVYAAPAPVYVAPPPVYVAPAPVYYVAPPPVYFVPRPVYAAPVYAPVVVVRDRAFVRHHGHGHPFPVRPIYRQW